MDAASVHFFRQQGAESMTITSLVTFARTYFNLDWFENCQDPRMKVEVYKDPQNPDNFARIEYFDGEPQTVRTPTGTTYREVRR